MRPYLMDGLLESSGDGLCPIEKCFCKPLE